MVFVYVALVITGLYIIFIVAPSAVAAWCVMTPRPGIPFEEVISKDPRFRIYETRIRNAKSFLDGIGPEEVSCVSGDGTRLCGYYYDNGSDKTALFVHGYRADPFVCFSLQGEYFAAKGYNLLFAIQRGHPGSGGKHVTLGLKESSDIPAWTGFLKDRGSRSAVVYGVSMGGFAAALATADLDPSFVKTAVIDSAYTSPYDQLMRDCKKRRLPGRLMMPFVALFSKLFFGVDIKQSAPESLGRSKIPAFFIHGSADSTVPPDDGEKNFHACASTRRFYIANGAEHVLSFAKCGDDIKASLSDFIEKQYRNIQTENSI